MGAAWGAPIAAVEVQIDNGPWMAARLESHALHRKRSRGYAWRFWTFEWGTPASGEHMIRSRAFDVDRNVQPAPSNGEITRGSAFTDGPWGVLRETGATAVAGNDEIVMDAERLACACSVHALTAIWFSEIPTCTPLSHRMI
jgi:hypothetical protein